MKIRNTSSALVLSRSFSLIAIGFFFTVGCSKGDGQTASDPNTAGDGKRVQELSLEERKAESAILTDEGEDLLQPSSLNEAHGKFAEAQKLDPENARARFLDAMIGPTLELKGILARIKPFYQRQPYGAERYAQFLQRVFEGRPSPWRSFLLSGPADIETMEGMQEWLDRVLARMSAYRETIKATKHETLDIRLPEEFAIFVGVFRSSSGSTGCKPTKLGPIKVQTRSCNQKGYFDFELNRADLEVLQNLWGAAELYFGILNTYTWNPDYVVHGRYTEPTAVSEQGQRLDLMKLFDEGRYGQLRSRQKLASLKGLFTDAALSYRYLLNNQQEACGHSRHKRGHFVLSDGFCLDRLDGKQPPAERYLATFEAILAGQPLELEATDQTGRPVAIKPLAYFDDPITDLSQLGPFTVDNDNHLSAFNSSLVDRYFASGSIDDLIRASRAKRTKRLTEVAQ